MQVEIADIKFVEQPQSTFQFRSYSEKDQKHGFLKSRDNRLTKIVAKFGRMCPKECFVMINLCNTDSYDKNKLKLSRHLIQKRQPMEPITTQLLHGQMTPTENAANTFEYELSDATIFSPYEIEQKDPEKKNYHKSNILYTKYIEYEKWRNGKEELSADDITEIEKRCKSEVAKKLSDVSRNARLSFTVYSKIPGTNKPKIHGTEYSDIIVNAKAFYIKTICNTHVSTAGGQTMYVLLSDIKYDHLIVKIFEKNDKVWEKEIKKPKKWVGNNTISFTVPKYTNGSADMRIDCYLKIKAQENDIQIEAQPELFFYINTEFEIAENNKRRKTNRPGQSNTVEDNEGNDENMDISSADRNEESVNESQIKVLKIIKGACLKLRAFKITEGEFLQRLQEQEKAYKEKHGVSIFYDSIAFDKFQEYTYLGSKSLNQFMASLTNERMENLLHYACRLNKSRYIIDLVSVGCEIDAQEIRYYSTPLHIAITSDHTECVAEFIKIIKLPKRWGDVEDALKHLATLYDFRGFTVVHAAAENNQLDLMKTMLEMSKEAKIDILHTKTLSLEHTILDLAADACHTEMEDLIREALKNDIYANYISLDDDDDDGGCTRLSDAVNASLSNLNLHSNNW